MMQLLRHLRGHINLLSIGHQQVILISWRMLHLIVIKN